MGFVIRPLFLRRLLSAIFCDSFLARAISDSSHPLQSLGPDCNLAGPEFLGADVSIASAELALRNSF